MANTLGLYDPLFYANEALIQLEKVLGMASHVHRGYEKDPQTPGSIIKIRRPGTFVAQSMPISTPADILPDEVTVTLNRWFGVVFALTDQELTYTTEKIISEHIRPAAVALADKIDDDLCGLYADVPWFVEAQNPGAIVDFTSVRQLMFDNKVPNVPRFMMINGEREADYLSLAAFNEADKSSDGGATQRDGFLGRKFGYDIWANQNVKLHDSTAISVTMGTLSNTAQVAVGATSFTLSATAVTGTLKKGDTLSFAGITQRFAVAADVTFAGNSALVTVSEPNRVVIPITTAATPRQLDRYANLAFHRNAFALAMAPLTQIGDGMGARIATSVDPITNLALRSRMWYEGKEAKTYIGIDALWGVKTLDATLAVRLESP